MDHQGNLILRRLVEEYSDKYEAVDRNKKKSVTLEVLHIIKQSGRFIKEENVGWIEVSDDVARQKVSHGFRDLRQAERRKENKQKKTETSVADYDFLSHGEEF